MKTLSAAELRAEVKRLLGDGDTAAAQRLLVARVQAGPAFFEYPGLARDLAATAAESTPFRLGILATYTLDQLRDVLRAIGLAERFAIEPYFGGYQQLEQELLDPASGLAHHNPAAVVLAWRLEDLAPALWDAPLDLDDAALAAAIDALLARIRGLVEAGRTNLPAARLLLHSFVAPSTPALGVIDAEHPRGHAAIVGALNRGLVELARTTTGVHLVDCERLARSCGRTWFEARHWYTSHAAHAPDALVEIAREYVKYVRALAGKTKKVVAVDLDNTLWGGVLGEDGVDGVGIGTTYPGNTFVAFQRELGSLAARGVVLAIASKNNEPDVVELFATRSELALRLEDFSAKRINWNDKATSLRELADELSLGLDSFVFIDDNPAEIEIIARELPDVTTVLVPKEPAELPGLLTRLGYFDAVIYSEEDRKRTELYRAEAERAALERGATDLEGFYRSLDMELVRYTIGGEANRELIPRVAQLTQKTNQFNMTTRRYSENDIERMAADPHFAVRAYRLADRFGDNGVISVVIAEEGGEAWRMDTFLMSCRVIGRTVETAILALVAEEARRAGAHALAAEFLPTRKNAPAAGVYERHGFAKTGETTEGSRWQLPLAESKLTVPEWIRLAEGGSPAA